MGDPSTRDIVWALRAHLLSSAPDHSVGTIRRWREETATVVSERRVVARSADIRALVIEHADERSARIRLDADVETKTALPDGRHEVVHVAYRGTGELLRADDGWKVAELPFGLAGVTDAVADRVEGTASTDVLEARAVVAWLDTSTTEVVVDVANRTDRPLALADATVAIPGLRGEKTLPARCSTSILPTGTTTRVCFSTTPSAALVTPLTRLPRRLRVVIRTVDGAELDLGVTVGSSRPSHSVRGRLHVSRAGAAAALALLAVLAVGLAHSWRVAGWLAFAAAAGWLLVLVRDAHARGGPRRPWAAAVVGLAVAGAALVLLDGGVPFAGCGSATGKGIAREADAFVLALAENDRAEMARHLGDLTAGVVPVTVSTPTSKGLRFTLGSRERVGTGVPCGAGSLLSPGPAGTTPPTGCFRYELVVQDPASGYVAGNVLVGLDCHGKRWRVDTIGSDG